jgi:hypothetical protein
MIQHTSGPWTAFEQGMGDMTIRTADPFYSTQRDIAEVLTFNDARCGARAQADCRLIAAAPDLLMACTKALIIYNHLTTEDFKLGKDKRARDLLDAAIRKAKGE